MNQLENKNPNEREEEIGSYIKEFEPRDEIVNGEDGWLSPKGIFYPCGTTEHDEAAKYLLSEKSPDHDYIFREHIHDYSNDDPDRIKLLKIGYILVHGPVVIPERFANLTINQLNVLNKAHILIIDPIDNSKCSTEFIIETVNNLQSTAKAILNTHSYKETFKHVERIFEETGIESKDLNTKFFNSHVFAEKYNELIVHKYNNMPWQEKERYNAKGPFPSYYAFESAANIEDFIKSPFEGGINITDNEKLTEEVFEILSNGFIEGVKIESLRHKWWYREIPTLDPNIFITIFRTYYHHDGMSGGMTGDVNEYVSARIQTKYQIENELSKRIKEIIERPDETKNLPKVTREGSKKLYKI